MQENDGKRIERTVVWLDAKLVPRMDGWLAADNCKNRSEFINKALRFYMGYLGTEDNTAYLSQAILTAIQGTLDDNNNRLCRMPSATRASYIWRSIGSRKVPKPIPFLRRSLSRCGNGRSCSAAHMDWKQATIHVPS